MARHRVVIKFDSAEQKRQWLEICNNIDPEASYKEIVEMLHHYLDDKKKFDAVKRASEGPKFR